MDAAKLDGDLAAAYRAAMEAVDGACREKSATAQDGSGAADAGVGAITPGGRSCVQQRLQPKCLHLQSR